MKLVKHENDQLTVLNEIKNIHDLKNCELVQLTNNEINIYRMDIDFAVFGSNNIFSVKMIRDRKKEIVVYEKQTIKIKDFCEDMKKHKISLNNLFNTIMCLMRGTPMNDRQKLAVEFLQQNKNTSYSNSIFYGFVTRNHNLIKKEYVR